MAKSATASARGESKSPKTSSNASPTPAEPPKSDVNTDKSTDASDASKQLEPLAPPPCKPTGTSSENFSGQPAGSLSLEPNPFEQSFGAPGAPETPGGTKLPPVAALASPASLLPGASTPFNWGVNSLRTGPLSPAMLSGPANDYFSDHLRGGYTPNESSMRTGLTPGGGGSMFPAASPGSQALFAQLQSGGATPSTLDFHRTAMTAAAAKRDQQAQLPQPVTSQPQDLPIKTETKPPTGPYDPHDNDAANGLFLLANQGRNGTANPNTYASVVQPQVHAHPVPMPPQADIPQMNGGGSTGNRSARGASEAGSVQSDESQPARPNTRGRGKRNSAMAGRRKAENEPMAKAPPNKRAKANRGSAVPNFEMEASSEEEEEEEDKDGKGDNPKSKMTDEEKRKNFLERNRVAALKCRQRKKQWLANLQSKVEMYTTENDALSNQISQLREEVVNLKTLLLAHKDCPVTQQQGLHNPYLQQQAAMDSYTAQMNPYNMAGPAIPPQPVLAGQVGGQRRYS